MNQTKRGPPIFSSRRLRPRSTIRPADWDGRSSGRCSPRLCTHGTARRPVNPPGPVGGSRNCCWKTRRNSRRQLRGTWESIWITPRGKLDTVELRSLYQSYRLDQVCHFITLGGPQTLRGGGRLDSGGPTSGLWRQGSATAGHARHRLHRRRAFPCHRSKCGSRTSLPTGRNTCSTRTPSTVSEDFPDRTVDTILFVLVGYLIFGSFFGVRPHRKGVVVLWK